ncbi:hypothetical protein ACFL67_03915 [candidate division KSB1 bacterium]
MAIQYYEVTMVGSFPLIRGFVHGYLLGKGIDRRPFFHRKSGVILRDTLLGGLKTLLDMENRVTFCMRRKTYKEFEEILDSAKERFGIYVKEVNKIKSVEFNFKHDIRNNEVGDWCKELINSKLEGVDIFDYVPVEEHHPEVSDMKFKGTASKYSYIGSGMVYGELYPVVDFFFKIKRHKYADYFTCTDLKLNLED